MGNTVNRITLIASFVLMAFSSAHAVWYVDRDSTHPNPNGTSWTRAFPTIQPAIDAAFAAGGGEVWIAEGTYNEQRTSADPDSGVDTGSIVMRDGVGLYGGFAGTEEFRHERNTLRHRTIIDGSTARNGEPAYHVVVGASDIVLDGLTITGGRADRPFNSTDEGGGIYISSCANVLISGCIISDNFANWSGGGIHSSLVENLVVERSAFIGNSLREEMYAGPALLVWQGTVKILDTRFEQNYFGPQEDWEGVVSVDQAQQAEIKRCRFESNVGLPLSVFGDNDDLGVTSIVDSDFLNNQPWGQDSIGALYLLANQPHIDGNTFIGHTPNYFNPVVLVRARSEQIPGTFDFDQHFTFRNCLFAGNDLNEAYAPAIELGGGNFTLEHFTFAGNYADNEHWSQNARGVVMHLSNSAQHGNVSRLTIRNSILWNSALLMEFDFRDVINANYYTPPLIDDSIVRGGYEGNEIYTAQPQFINDEDGDYRLMSSSPGVDQGQAYNAPEPDILGTPRPAGEFVDLGAFEVINGVPPLCEVADRAEAQFARLPFAADELTDLDDDGLPELASLRLLAEAACNYGSPENLSVAAAYEANFEAANGEPFDMRILRNREMIAAAMTVSDTAQETLRDALAKLGVVLLNDYVVAECGANGEPCVPSRGEGAPAVNSSVSGLGDFDADGMSNADEWAAVLAENGTLDDFVAVATDPAVRGSSHESTVNASCFIATAAYGTQMAAEIQPLREIRDAHLLKTSLGAAFTDAYYRLSPPIADLVARHDGVRRAVRAVLAPIVGVARWVDPADEAAATD